VAITVSISMGARWSARNYRVPMRAIATPYGRPNGDVCVFLPEQLAQAAALGGPKFLK
jgi:hypothetical protein